jgi:FkbM family methyltransferase
MPLLDRLFLAPVLQKLLARAGLFRLDARLSAAAAQHVHASLLHSVLDRYSIDCVLDVGANQGQFASSLRANGYRGPIVSFEPVAEQFRALSAHAASDPNWHVRPEALGSTDSTRDIHVMRRSEFSSFLAPTPDQPSHSAGRNEILHTEFVSVRRLDSLAPSIPPLDSFRHIFLKLDTQGFDLDVFAGAAALLPRIDVLQSELSMVPIYQGMPHFTDALAQYDAAGFILCSLVPVVRDPHTLIPIECDCLLLRRDALPRK